MAPINVMLIFCAHSLLAAAGIWLGIKLALAGARLYFAVVLCVVCQGIFLSEIIFGSPEPATLIAAIELWSCTAASLIGSWLRQCTK